MEMNLKSRRIQRVEKKLRQIVAKYFLSGHFRANLKGLVSVSNVKVSSDLRMGKVFISVLGSEKDKQKSLREILLRSKDVQGQVNRELRMKFNPRLQFFLDKTTEEALKLENLIQKMNKPPSSI